MMPDQPDAIDRRHVLGPFGPTTSDRGEQVFPKSCATGVVRFARVRQEFLREGKPGAEAALFLTRFIRDR